MSKNTMETLETDDTRALDIVEFIDLDRVDLLFYENKVAVARWVSGGKERPVVEKRLQLAEMLIGALSAERFDPLEFKDEYRQRLLERIEETAQGKIAVSEAREEAKGDEVVDIMEAPRQSLERVRGAAAPAHGRLRRAPKPAPAAGRKTRTPPTTRRRKAS